MEKLKRLIHDSQLLSVFGEVDERAINNSQFFISFKDNGITFDFSQVYSTLSFTGKTVIENEPYGITLALEFKNGILDGNCSIQFKNVYQLSGKWIKGLRNGPFEEKVYDTVLYNGDYVSGLRNGVCTAIGEDSIPMTINYSFGYISSNKSMVINGVYVSVLSRNNVVIEISDIPQHSDDYYHVLQFSEGTGSPSSLSLWRNRQFVRAIIHFGVSEDYCSIMTAFNDMGHMVYKGEYYYLPPFSFSMHGHGQQFLNQSLLYEGMLSYGKREGTGMLFYKNNYTINNKNTKVKYNGMWKGDIPDGKGVIFDNNGKLFQRCDVKNGKIQYGFRKYTIEEFVPKESFLNLFFRKNDDEYYYLNQRLIPSDELVVPIVPCSRRVFSSANSTFHLETNQKNAENTNVFKSIMKSLGFEDLHVVRVLTLDCSLQCFDIALIPQLESLTIDTCFDLNGNLTINSHPFIHTIHIKEHCLNNPVNQRFTVNRCPALYSLCIDSNSLSNCSLFTIYGILCFLS